MNNIVLEGSLIENGKIIKSIDKSGDYILDLKSNQQNLVININKGLTVNITEIISNDINNSITYNLEENIKLNINILDDSNNSNRDITINLNGSNSIVDFNAGIISHKENKYKLNVFHNMNNSKSSINLHGITLGDSKILIENNGYIPKGSYKSVLKQDNKIITMGSNNSKIEPNLYIDEYDIEASHGAYIGKFDDDTLFYLNSRGLDYDSSYSLLIKGFLLEGFNINDSLKNEILKIINKYWR